MDSVQLLASLEANARFEFARSSGPGGQNVNKVNSASTLRIGLDRLEGLSETERVRLADKLKNRINAEGELTVRADDTRSQLENRRLAFDRAMALIVQALHREKPRRATKPSRASRERRMASKKAAGTTKKNRGRPDAE